MLSPLTMIVSWLCNTRRRQQTQRPDLVSHEEPRGVARNFDGTSLEAAGGSLADQFLNSSSVSWWILFQYDILGGSNMWYIFAQCLPPLKQDIWIRSRSQDVNVALTETFAFTQQTKHMPPFLILYLTVWYLLLHSINGSWSDPVMITVILFGSSESGLDLVKINWTWDDPLKYLQSWWRMAVAGSQQTKTVPSLTRCCHSVILRSDWPQGSLSHLFEIVQYYTM